MPVRPCLFTLRFFFMLTLPAFGYQVTSFFAASSRYGTC